MDEKDLPPAPPLESTSASSSSKENDGKEEKAKIAQTANASSSTEEEEGEVEKITRSFPDLPSIVMEYILAHFSYFEVLQMRLISSSWNDLIKGYLNKADEVFQHNLARHNVQWLSVKEVIKDFKQPSEEVAPISRSSSSNLLKKPIVPKMSPRYHHCACYLNDSMYIFGGCIAPNTAYNDLWRFDMTSKHWTRIIAAGTPPLPRIFCSFTPYETADEATGERRQYIVLFGGFLFDENLATRDRLLWNIHLYDIAENRWTQLPIGPLVEEEGKSNPNQQHQQQPPQSQQQQQLLLRSGNHSAVVIGDELIVFNGLRYVSTLGGGPFSQESEVPCNHVYAFHLREHCWRRVDGCPADQPGHHHRVSPRKSVRCPLHFDIRSTLEATQPMCTRRKAATQTPVALDAHHILYICGCSSNVLFIGAFLLTRERCHQSNCELCLKKEEEEEEEEESEGEEMTTKEGGVEEQQLNKEAAVGGSKKQQRKGKAQKKEEKDDDTRWKWAKVEISKEGLDFEFTHGVEFCKVGNMMAYLTAKDVAVPVRRHPPPPPPPPPPPAKPKPSPSSSSSQPKKSSTSPPHPPRSQSAPSTSSSSSSSSSSSESAARAASVATVYPSIPPLHHFRGPPQHVNSHASNRQLLRERRIESLDYYQRQFEQLHPPQQLNQQQQQLQNQQMLVAQLEVVVRAVENGHYRDYLNRREEQENAAAAAARAAAPALPVPAVITRYSDSTTVHRSSLQLSLLDISRVITERRIERVRQRHEMDYSVVPDALAAYSLVAAPSGLLLFGGYVVNTNQPGQHSTPRDVYEAAVLNEGPAVSSKLFIIASKPEMRLY